MTSNLIMEREITIIIKIFLLFWILNIFKWLRICLTNIANLRLPVKIVV